MFIIIPFVTFGVFFTVFLIIGFSAFKLHKRTGDTMKNIINTVSAGFSKEFEEVRDEFNNSKDETKICEYCGSTISSNSTKCDSCGAKVKNKIYDY